MRCLLASRKTLKYEYIIAIETNRQSLFVQRQILFKIKIYGQFIHISGMQANVLNNKINVITI